MFAMARVRGCSLFVVVRWLASNIAICLLVLVLNCSHTDTAFTTGPRDVLFKANEWSGNTDLKSEIRINPSKELNFLDPGQNNTAVECQADNIIFCLTHLFGDSYESNNSDDQISYRPRKKGQKIQDGWASVQVSKLLELKEKEQGFFEEYNDQWRLDQTTDLVRQTPTIQNLLAASPPASPSASSHPCLVLYYNIAALQLLERSHIG